jgi:transglutaminase-like putative cysteine protease
MTVTALEVTHETRYDYTVAVSPALHLAHLQPLSDRAQSLLAFRLEVEPEPDGTGRETDVWGNPRHLIAVLAPHRRLTVRAISRVEVAPRFDGLEPAAGPAWETVAARLRYVARAPFEPAAEFVMPSPFVPRLEVLRAYAQPSFPPGRPVAAGALDLMRRVHADFRYDGDATQVDTPVERAFEQKRGVCQDFAHLMAGALRMLGLPARYVSGYLLTTPAAGQPALVGADASHAWVQAWVPGTPGVPADGWLDLDPTNDLVPSSGHIRLAVGRDFGDVTPLRGVIRGGGAHTLTVGVHTREISGPEIAQARQEQ